MGTLTLILVSFSPLSAPPSGAEASGMNFTPSRFPRDEAERTGRTRLLGALMRTLLISSAGTSSSGLKVCPSFTVQTFIYLRGPQ